MPAAALAKLVGPDWIESRRRAWGERSPLAGAGAGEFPSTTDDTVCALAEVEAARARELEPGLPLIIAVDVARFGSDQTVFCVRAGNVARLAKVYGGRDLMQTTGQIVDLARQLQRNRGHLPTIVIDDAGLGGGVTDRLRELGEFPVDAFLGAGAARDSREYPNKRSQGWFDLADVLPLIDIDDDEELAADLLAPRYVLDSAGRRVVEAKAEKRSGCAARPTARTRP